jgi:putative spermidine/putrescine transport system substrate-binding protein
MSKKTLIAASAGLAMLVASVPSVSVAATLTATSWGGSYSASQRKAYYEPFMKETGHTVLEDEWGGEIAFIRAMVETSNYKTHVIDAVPDVVIAGCDEGILEPLDWSKLGITPDDMLPGAGHECGVGTISWSTLFAYRSDVYPDNPPTSWADFYDAEKFPGKRGMYKNNPVFQLEFALIADGVSAADVYDVLGGEGGVDRAFDKMATIKEHVIWWETGAQAPQLLADKEVIMTTGWNGRFYNAVVDDGQPFVLVWNGQGMDYDFWVIPAGHPEADLAHEFIAFASTPERQGDQTNYISYGPLRKGADKFVNPDILPHLPTAPANTVNWFQKDVTWWADHREELTNRFASWLAK